MQLFVGGNIRLFSRSSFRALIQDNCLRAISSKSPSLSSANIAAAKDVNETVEMTDVKSSAKTATSTSESPQLDLSAPEKADNVSQNAAQPDKKAQWLNRPYFEGRKDLPRKAAILFMYYGGGYYGLQRNPYSAFTVRNNVVYTELRTIEDELLTALLKCEAITREQYECPQAMNFQRAARTDKGVSALGNVVTTKLRLDRADADRLNTHLPPQIRVLDVLRTTRSFDAKVSCTHRTYMYFLPTFTLTPFDQQVYLNDAQVDPGQVEKFRSVMRMYIGSHRFHNFTSGKTYEDASARRFIMDVNVSDAFKRDGLEFVLVTIKGQSFMLHQIRKMVGLGVAITRGFCDASMIEVTRGPSRFDVPKIPGLGLTLDAVHYDSYNRRYGSDGAHPRIAFDAYRDRIDRFRDEMLLERIVRTERTERIIWEWMKTLCMHSYQPVILDGQVLPGGVLATRYTKPLSLNISSRTSSPTNGTEVHKTESNPNPGVHLQSPVSA